MDFDSFFREEAEGLARLCWLLTLDRADASDLAQETMTRAWEHWDELSQPGSSPRAWVRTVATNRAASRWRRIRRLRSRLPLIGTPSSVDPAWVVDPAMLHALKALPLRQRQVLILRYWGDLTIASCAEMLDVSVGTVKQHLARAHAQLASDLGPVNLEEMLS